MRLLTPGAIRHLVERDPEQPGPVRTREIEFGVQGGSGMPALYCLCDDCLHVTKHVELAAASATARAAEQTR